MIVTAFFAAQLSAAEVGTQAGPEMRAAFPPEASLLSQGREVKAKVLVAYTIKPDGTVSDVQVVKAEPPGPWESQAVERVQSLVYSGMIVPGYQEIVVTFFQD